MSALHFTSTGAGAPLLLVHGTGASQRTWAPIVDRLAEHRRVVLVDLPGHGRSGPMPDGVAPTPRGYARVLANFLDEQGVERPAVAGFSVGGWTALELAREGRASSVVALAPAGLWQRNARRSVASLRLARRMSRVFAPVAPLALRSSAGRSVLLGQNVGRPWKVPPDAAIGLVRDMASTRDFDRHLRLTSGERFVEGADIDVPVTVAFGSREALIPAANRLRDELPPDVRWIRLPHCGHIPFWDDPELVAEVILEATEAPATGVGTDGASAGDWVHSKLTGERFRELNVPAQHSRAVTRLDWFLEPGRESPVHVHPYQEERVIGLSGELVVRVGDQRTVCRTGEVVPIPAGVAHTFANRADSEAHMLVEFRPALKTADFFTAIANVPSLGISRRGGARPNPIRAADELWRYRREFRLASPPAPAQYPVLAALAGVSRLAVAHRGGERHGVRRDADNAAS